MAVYRHRVSLNRELHADPHALRRAGCARRRPRRSATTRKAGRERLPEDAFSRGFRSIGATTRASGLTRVLLAGGNAPTAGSRRPVRYALSLRCGPSSSGGTQGPVSCRRRDEAQLEFRFAAPEGTSLGRPTIVRTDRPRVRVMSGVRRDPGFTIVDTDQSTPRLRRCCIYRPA